MEVSMTAIQKRRADEAKLSKRHMLNGGKWVDSASGEVLEVEDPAHRCSIAEVPRGRAEDVERAVKAAAGAFPAWSRMVPRERGRLLARYFGGLGGELKGETIPLGEHVLSYTRREPLG